MTVRPLLRSISLASVVLSSIALPQTASAINSQTKQELTALGTIAVATAAGGPVGFVLGALGGGWLAGQVGDAHELSLTEQELGAAEAQLASVRASLQESRKQLDELRAEKQRFAKMALEQLQLEMLFTSGDSTLTTAGRQRLALLSAFLRRNPDLEVNIEGFADPRGSQQANYALSQARADAVAQALAAEGVAAHRLRVMAHGETLSTAQQGDLDAYALERLVRIELRRSSEHEHVADVTLRSGR